MTRPIAQTLFIIFLFVSGAFHSQAGDAVLPWNLPRFGDDATTLYTAAANIPYAAGTDVLVIDDEESYVVAESRRALGRSSAETTRQAK